MLRVTFTCSRCGIEETQHEPSQIELPDGWRFVVGELLCPACEALTE